MIARTIGEGVSMFDPRVRAHSREQAIIMAAFRFPKSPEKEQDEAFDRDTENSAMRDAYEFGDQIFEEPPDEDPDELAAQEMDWANSLYDTL